MGKLGVVNNLTLDGVMQAPGRADEDTRDGFRSGGWAQSYTDQVMMAEMGKGMAEPGSMLFGRRTWEDFARVWPNQPADNPFAAHLNNAEKYVVSTTLTEPLAWSNSTLINHDPIETIADLKQQSGGEITILGSGELIRSLLRHDLIDTFTLLIHPLVLGSGRRLFTEDGNLATFELVRSVPTTTGVIIATYRLPEA